MPEVKTALPAKKLKPFPSVRGKLNYLHAAFKMRPKRRETAARIKPGCFAEQRSATGCTNKPACGLNLIGKIELLFFQE